MTFNIGAPEQNRGALLKETWRRRQCDSCSIKPTCPPVLPQTHQNQPIDILFITDPDCKASSTVSYHLIADNRRYLETKLIECANLTDTLPDEQAKESCFGRKLKLIEIYKPKIVLAMGPKTYFTFEAAAGLEGDLNADLIPLPTRIEGHDFWLIQIPIFGLGAKFNETRFYNILNDCIAKPPTVLTGNFDNIEFAVTPSEIQAAFKDLRNNSHNVIDIETNAFRPFFNDAKILTVGLGTFDRTYVMPCMHPQTSAAIDPFDILQGVDELAKASQMIAFSDHFEYEWLAHFLGAKFLLGKLWDDVQMQVYVLRTKPVSLSLNSLIRRKAGFEFKAMSNVDRGNLENTPLEQVLMYNGGDIKWTYWAFEEQRAEIQKLGLEFIYRRRLENVWAHVPLSLRGVDIDWEFVYSQADRLKNLTEIYSQAFKTIPEVQAYEGKYGPIRISQKLDKLFHEFLNVPKEVTSFNDDFLSSFDHPISTTIQQYREEAKLLSTYIEPVMIDNRAITPWKHKKPKCQVMEDLRIHGLFQAWGTVTGRPSGTNMNMLNWPSRGVTGSGFVKKKLRNCITAPEGYLMGSIDYAQIEARVIASLAEDDNYLKQLWEGFDIHMHWTKQTDAKFPGLFIADEIREGDPEFYNKALKGLRKEWKNIWTFPLLYNSANQSVYENAGLLIPIEKRSKFGESKFFNLIGEFWDAYPKIKIWQNGLGDQMDNTGKIVTPFGQEMRDLGKTEYCNYSSQSAAADICSTAQYRLIQMGLEQGDGRFYIVMNIYDDLTMYIKEDYLDDFLVDAIPIMVDTEYINTNAVQKDWYLAPLEVEVSVGKSWGNQSEYGVFSSKDL